jgi:hypothetical protein
VPGPSFLQNESEIVAEFSSFNEKFTDTLKPAGRRSPRCAGLLQTLTMADDELWHVRISADEVKTLTLEQIDDLYRLDVIDADTQLWQDGMDEWLPLRVVAGLDEAEVVNVSVPPTAPPPALAAAPVNAVDTLSSWPPAVAAPVAAQSSWPPAVVPSARPSAPVSKPPPPSARNTALAATVPSFPPAAAPSSMPAPFGLAPSFAPPPVSGSVRPQMVTPVPYAYPKPTNPMPIVLVALAGLIVTLYRNDLIHAGARTVGQEGAYLKLESALGGPGFGTLRAVEPLVKAAAALPDILPLPVSASPSKYDSSSSDSSDSKSNDSSAKSTAVSKPAPASQPETRKVAAQAQPQSASRAPTRPAAAESPNPVFKQPKGSKKAKGNEFDPLNPNL